MITMYCIVYRTGGVKNFRWHRSVADTKDVIVKMLADVRRMGYRAHMVKYNSSMVIGLPESYA